MASVRPVITLLVAAFAFAATPQRGDAQRAPRDGAARSPAARDSLRAAAKARYDAMTPAQRDSLRTAMRGRREAMRARWEAMPPAQRDSFRRAMEGRRDSMRGRRDAMSPASRDSLHTAMRARRDTMRARWASMTPAERDSARATMRARRGERASSRPGRRAGVGGRPPRGGRAWRALPGGTMPGAAQPPAPASTATGTP
jgi:hypothetical protein